MHIAKNVNFDLDIVTASVRVNDRQKEMMVEKIENVVGELKGKTIGILGLAFKPNTDDMREAASITIINGLKKKGANVQTFDPVAMDEAKHMITDVTYAENAYDAASGADALVILTEWNEFRYLDLLKIKELLRKPIFIDLRNIYEPERMERFGFTYVSLGRGKVAGV